MDLVLRRGFVKAVIYSPCSIFAMLRSAVENEVAVRFFAFEA